MNYTPRSLKLLEMPYLCKKLGFNTIDDERITGSVNYSYNSTVLVGNWQTERLGRVALGDGGGEMDLETTYHQDYRGERLPVDTRDLWNNRLHGMGSVEVGDDQHRMATVYDLAFRCRVRDFVSGDYGNITGYGKKECLQGYWDATINKDKSLRYHTEYKDAFSPTLCGTTLSTRTPSPQRSASLTPPTSQNTKH